MIQEVKNRRVAKPCGVLVTFIKYEPEEVFGLPTYIINHFLCQKQMQERKENTNKIFKKGEEKKCSNKQDLIHSKCECRRFYGRRRCHQAHTLIHIWAWKQQEQVTWRWYQEKTGQSGVLENRFMTLMWNKHIKNSRKILIYKPIIESVLTWGEPVGNN